jgi:hypothetical protein
LISLVRRLLREYVLRVACLVQTLRCVRVIISRRLELVGLALVFVRLRNQVAIYFLEPILTKSGLPKQLILGMVARVVVDRNRVTYVEFA